MKFDDLTEIVSSIISEKLLQYPAYIIVHQPSGGKQEITVASKDGRVYVISICQLKG